VTKCDCEEQLRECSGEGTHPPDADKQRPYYGRGWGAKADGFRKSRPHSRFHVKIAKAQEYPVHSRDAPCVRPARCTAPSWPHEQAKRLAHVNALDEMPSHPPFHSREELTLKKASSHNGNSSGSIQGYGRYIDYTPHLAHSHRGGSRPAQESLVNSL